MSKGTGGKEATPPRVTRATVTDAGVDRCVELMTRGEWHAGPSHKAVAAEFNVSPRTVEAWATNASRIIRRAMGDEEQIRTEMAASLAAVTKLALDRQAATMAGELYPNPDVKGAVAAIATRAKVLGLTDTKRAEASVPTTPEAMLAAVDERIAQLTAFRARLVARMNVVQALPAPDDTE